MADMDPGLRRDDEEWEGRTTAGSSCPAPLRRAVGAVFEDDALGGEIGADAVGVGETAFLPGECPIRDACIDSVIGYRGVLPILRGEGLGYAFVNC